MSFFKKSRPQDGTVPAVTQGPTVRAKPTYTDLLRTPQIANVTNPRTLGPTFHTADQNDQRLYLGAGYDGDKAFNADPGTRQTFGPDDGSAPGFANVVRTRRHPDGTCDAVKLEATSDGWIDLGGATPKDFKVVNW